MTAPLDNDVTATGVQRPGRARARKGDGARLRAEILEAATSLLLETGDEAAVSVRAVAKRVGVTPPSIYLHFADKKALIFACCSRLLEQTQELIASAVVQSDDPMERLRIAAAAFVRFGIDNPEPYRIMLMSPHHEVPADLDVGTYGGTLAFNALTRLVNDALGIAEDAAPGQVQDGALSAMAILSSIHGVTSLMVAKAVEPIDFPWPETNVLVDRVLDVHLADIQRRRAASAHGSLHG